MVYFLLMLYLANWVIQSIGQLFALATPNEESANGLGGLSIILSVILMGFLITVDAMPEGWEWAYWANLFHYALQGLVTNEIGENEYFVEIPKLLPEIDTNATGIVGFAGESVSLASGKQMAGFLSLALSARKGRNPDGNLADLSDLIDCTLKSGCFNDTIQPAAESFIECYLFDGVLSKPPCADEFGTVIESANFTQTQQCFEESGVLQDFLQSSPTTSGSDDDGEFPVNGTDILIVPSTNAPVENNLFLRPNSRKLQFISQELFVGLLPNFITRLAQGSVFGDADKKKLSTVSCLMSSILPPDGIRSAEHSIEEATGMVPVVALIENGGFDLPGEIILSFFGWAVYERGEGFVAPFKWWYCLGAVAIFLCGIEILKLYAIETIVWTNR